MTAGSQVEYTALMLEMLGHFTKVPTFSKTAADQLMFVCFSDWLSGIGAASGVLGGNGAKPSGE